MACQNVFFTGIMALRVMRKIDPRLELLMRKVYFLFVLFYDIQLSGHRERGKEREREREGERRERERGRERRERGREIGVTLK